MKIIDFAISQLRKPDLREFFEQFTAEASQCDTVVQQMGRWWVPYLTAWEEMERIYQISLKSDNTEEIFTLDSMRDGVHTSLKSATNALRKSMNEDTARAAAAVWNALGSFKVNIAASYITQTGQLDALLDELLGNQQENLQKLGLLSVAQKLKELNDQMHELIDQRDKENIDKVQGAFANARTQAIECYRKLVEFINAYALVHIVDAGQADSQLAYLIAKSNSIITRYKRVALKTSSPSPEAGETDHNPDDPSEPDQPVGPDGEPLPPATDEGDGEGGDQTGGSEGDQTGGSGSGSGSGGNTGGSGSGSGSGSNPGSGSGTGFPIQPGPGGDDMDL